MSEGCQIQISIRTSINPLSKNLGTIFFALFSEMFCFTRVLVYMVWSLLLYRVGTLSVILQILENNNKKRTIYSPQNNLRATSFIFPLIITKMRPSSFKIISWAKLEVSALFQSAQHVRNMFSYKSVNGQQCQTKGF